MPEAGGLYVHTLIFGDYLSTMNSGLLEMLL